jgi:hypothetical protein
MEGQVPLFISPRNRVAQLYPQALGSLSFASYDSQGLRWRYSNPPPHGFYLRFTADGDIYIYIYIFMYSNLSPYPVFQLLFVIYMGIVAILLVNMLIAMMGNTYQKIAETRNEWQRQVTGSWVANHIILDNA